jgi:hypothetical protein
MGILIPKEAGRRFIRNYESNQQKYVKAKNGTYTAGRLNAIFLNISERMGVATSVLP